MLTKRLQNINFIKIEKTARFILLMDHSKAVLIESYLYPLLKFQAQLEKNTYLLTIRLFNS